MRNFGMANPEGYRKALRLIRQGGTASSFQLWPFVDTSARLPRRRPRRSAASPGRSPTTSCAFAGARSDRDARDRRGRQRRRPRIGVGDRLLMMEHSIYSVGHARGLRLDPLARTLPAKVEGGRRAQADGRRSETARPGREIVPEPPGGAHNDYGVATDAAGAPCDAIFGVLEAIDIDRPGRGALPAISEDRRLISEPLPWPRKPVTQGANPPTRAARPIGLSLARSERSAEGYYSDVYFNRTVDVMARTTAIRTS